MKSLQIAVVLLVLYISTLEARVCMSCNEEQNVGNCRTSIKHCPSLTVCGKATNRRTNAVIKGCMTLVELRDYAFRGYKIFLCNTDLCNRERRQTS